MHVLKDKELRMKIVCLHHDILVVEYEEQWKTVKLVTRNFWWPKVIREIKQYVERYDMLEKQELHKKTSRKIETQQSS